MRLTFPKLFGYGCLLFIMALAQAVLVVQALEAPAAAHTVSFGMVVLVGFVGAQLLLAGLAIVFSFRRRNN